MFPRGTMMMSSGRPLQPSDLPPVKAWWSADAGVVKDGGGHVAAWRDRIADAELSTVGSVMWSDTAVNGAAGVVFNRGGDMNGVLPATAATGLDEGWVFVLSQQGAETPYETGDTLVSLGADYRLAIVKHIGNDVALELSVGGLNEGLGTVSVGGCDLAAMNYCSPVFGGSVQRGWLNEVDGDPISVGVPFTGNLFVGASEAGGRQLLGAISDIVVTTALTETQRQKLAACLLWSRGVEDRLPGGHPFASARPFF